MKRFLCIVILFLISFTGILAQNMDLRLALQYLKDGDYAKAAMYFEKIYDVDPSITNYNYYFPTLLELGEFKEAEKICKKQIKTNPDLLQLNVDLGNIYLKENKENKANDIFNEVIGGLNQSSTYAQLTALANAFEVIGKLNLALMVFEKGNGFYKDAPYLYNPNIAKIYARMGEQEKMVQCLLDMLQGSESYLSQVQSSLSNHIDFTSDLGGVELVKRELIKRSQQFPDKVVYNELLAWMFMQKGDFDNAFIQVKALDTKLKLRGREVLNLGETANNNDLFDVALSCSDYVIGLGEGELFYRKAKILKLNALKNKVLKRSDYTAEDLQALESNYLSSLEQIGKSVFSLSVIRQLANLYAFHLHEIDKAIELIQEAMVMPDVHKEMGAELKIELADYLTMQGDVWEASLLYAQVEKAFKHDPIGHEAKFKNAKIFYYSGDFEFSKSQLDVLKASTSKLIANDAMELSLLISDNKDMDTTGVTMKMFAMADLFLLQNRHQEALAIYDSIANAWTYHSLSDDMLMRRASVAIKEKKYDEAVVYLLEVIEKFSDDILADNALYKLAQLYDYTLGDQQKAYLFYKKIMFDFPGSLFVVEARKRFRALDPLFKDTGAIKEKSFEPQ